ncbi:hypothetical protein SVAN01_11491, partial [Stagonosporopsis vannaccii]
MGSSPAHEMPCRAKRNHGAGPWLLGYDGGCRWGRARRAGNERALSGRAAAFAACSMPVAPPLRGRATGMEHAAEAAAVSLRERARAAVRLAQQGVQPQGPQQRDWWGFVSFGGHSMALPGVLRRAAVGTAAGTRCSQRRRRCNHSSSSGEGLAVLPTAEAPPTRLEAGGLSVCAIVRRHCAPRHPLHHDGRAWSVAAPARNTASAPRPRPRPRPAAAASASALPLPCLCPAAASSMSLQPRLRAECLCRPLVARQPPRAACSAREPPSRATSAVAASPRAAPRPRRPSARAGMSWFLRGVQSAVFHYASCAPCTGYADGRKRRREAKLARKARAKLVLEQPGAYHHPEPTGTNPYWGEEIALGPGPPPRRARRATAGA